MKIIIEITAEELLLLNRNSLAAETTPAEAVSAACCTAVSTAAGAPAEAVSAAVQQQAWLPEMNYR